MSTVAALLGIWKSGAAYMPIDAEFPPERISFLLRDSEASLLVTEKDLLPPHSAAFQGRRRHHGGNGFPADFTASTGI